MSIELNSRMELRLASLTLKFSVVLPVQVLSTRRFSPMAIGIRKQGNLLEFRYVGPSSPTNIISRIESKRFGLVYVIWAWKFLATGYGSIRLRWIFSLFFSVSFVVLVILRIIIWEVFL